MTAPISSHDCLSIVVKTGVALFLAILVFGIVFNIYLYPRHGLSGFSEKNYCEAILKSGYLFAISQQMKLKDILYTNFRSQEDGKKHYAWGILRLVDHTDQDYPLWVSIRFGDQLEWYRDSIGLLVDPQDKLFFVEERPNNMFKTITELGRVYREGKRQLREYFSSSDQIDLYLGLYGQPSLCGSASHFFVSE
ncbi:conserved hypothetical protein [Desulfovibrionales bacterium]